MKFTQHEDEGGNKPLTLFFFRFDTCTLTSFGSTYTVTDGEMK